MGPDNYQQMQWTDPLNTDSSTWPKTPAFTADSSNFVYYANTAAGSFFMTQDGEYDDFTCSTGLTPMLSPVGGHYGFIGESRNHKKAVMVDGKAQVFSPKGNAQLNISCLSFSPDGGHYAFVNGYVLYEDGKPMDGGIDGQKYLFSPDGKHIAYCSYGSPLAIDGKLVQTDVVHRSANFPFFSPDSRHFYWTTVFGRIANTTDTNQIFLDGKPVAHFSDDGTGHSGIFNYEFSPDGALTFIVRTDGELTRYTVTPDSNIDAMLSAAKPAPNTNLP